jgi:hypothetical protein
MNLVDTGKHNIPLLQQDDCIKAMLRRSILKITGDLLFENIFPDGEERTCMSCNTVAHAGKEMKLDDVVNQLKNDINYLDQLARVVRHSRVCEILHC